MILFVLITLTCVNATNNQTDEITTLESDIITDEILTDENNGTFNELNNEIFAKDTYELTKNYTYNSETDWDYRMTGILITKENFVLDGKGYTLNGKNQARIFTITAKNVTLKNINFIKGYADYGGAIYFKDYSNGNVTNCNFTINQADIGGGAIFYAQNGDKVFVKNCNFVNNKVTHENSYGSAIMFTRNATLTDCNFTDNSNSYRGGAVIFEHGGDVKNCNFINNTAYEGGAVYFNGSGTVINCNFTDNTASGDGGAVYINNSGTVTNCNFTDNTASSYGGAVYISSGTVLNCNFIGNNANDGGGAIRMGSGTVSNCIFTDNKANGSYNDGGAIYFSDSGKLVNCNFTDNTVSASGGAVNFNNNGEITNCNFINNTAFEWGGAVIFKTNGEVTNCTFTDNKATEGSNYGGAVYFSGSGTVINSNFTDNTANTVGGAVYFGSSSNVTNCNFVNNTADWGGAVYGQQPCTVAYCNFTGNSANNAGALHLNSGGTVAYCNFADNTANEKSGAAYFMSKVNLNNCNFSNNTAGNYGAVFLDSSSNVTNCNFINNSAVEGNAGAIYFKSRGNVLNCNFINNNASGDGGAIWMDSGNVTNCNFINNNASGNGGAILSQNSQGGTVDTCIFKTSSDTTYQTINLPPILDVDNFTTFYNFIEKLTFKLKTNSGIPVNNGIIFISIYNKNNNTLFGNYTCISGEGWAVDLPLGSYYAIFNTEYEEFKLVNRTITILAPTFWALNDRINSNQDSVINLNCDFYFDSDSDADFEEGIEINRPVTINGNGYTIDANGKARIFLVKSGNVVLENITFRNGHIPSNGGAVFFSSHGNVLNCNFVNNSAINYDGGAVYFMNDGGNVSNCNFTDNSAKFFGGAVYMNEGNVSNCNFNKNKLTDLRNSFGGAVYIDGNGEVTYCNFTDNSANGDGGAIWMISGSVENCNFSNNFASRGGAILSNEYWGVTVDTCIFKTSSDTTYNTRNLPPTLDVDDFLTIYNSSEKLTFDLKTNSGIPVNNGIIFISIYNKNNNTLFGNYTCISGEGWTVDLPAGFYYAIFNTEYAAFQPVNRTITIIPETTFWALNYRINSDYDSMINLSNDFYLDLEFDADFANGIEINRPVTINGNGHTINANGKARIFLVRSGNVVLENITFRNGRNEIGSGGAVYFMHNGNVSNCNFTHNYAYNSGAIFFNQAGNLTNCNFVNNSASTDGGAVSFRNGGNVTVCNFIGNDAKSGGAISTSGDLSISDSNFKENTAVDGSNNIILNGDVKLILNNVTPEDLGPIYKGNMEIINVTNTTYPGTTKITVKVTDAKNNPVNNGTVSVTIENKEYSADVVNATATITIPDLNVGGYNVNVIYQGKYAVLAKNVKFIVFKTNSSVIINPIEDLVYGNITFIKFDVVNRTEVDVIVYDEMGTSVFEKHNYTESNVTVPILPVGRYNVTITNKETENYAGSVNSTVFHVIKANNTVKVEVNDVIYGTDVVVNVIAGVDGEYLINVNDTVKKVNVINGSGNMTFTLGAGSYWANATFNNGNYSSNITNATFNVFKANSSVIINPIADVVYGNTTSVTFDVDNRTEVEVIVYDEMGLIVFEKHNCNESNVTVPILPVGTYNVTITNKENKNYTSCVNSTVFHVIKANNTVKVEVNDVIYGNDVLVNVISGVDGEYLINVNGTVKKVNVINGTGNAAFTLDVGCYWANATFNNGNYSSNITNTTFNVFKANTLITAINKAYVINYDGKYSVTLKDAEGRLITGQMLTFTLNDKDIESAVSDANGIATITLTAKILKAAKAGKKNLIVKFSGTQNYNPISKTVKITVNKEKTKITAKKKTFKKTVKVKKYTITLKNSKGKAVKKVKVTLKIKGKTYKAKTNTKGKATFKIKKLTKKGIFKAKINFKATSLYLKSAKTVKIRIK